MHNEALAYELAARFYAARGFETIAQAYLRNARYGYLRWGADGKVRQLDQLYPHLRTEEAAAAPTNTIGAPVEHLDLATVIKVSQAVSGEIVLEKLLDTLMRTAIEHAGAERGLLLLPRGDELRIAAEATTRGDTVIVRLTDQSMAAAALPESIVQYVVRTQDSVLLDDAAAPNAFAADAALGARHARSILCVPLRNQAKLTGVLYLENTLTPHVFTPTRSAVLTLLASQAAISLENARLYAERQRAEATVRRSETAAAGRGRNDSGHRVDGAAGRSQCLRESRVGGLYRSVRGGHGWCGVADRRAPGRRRELCRGVARVSGARRAVRG